MTALGLWVDDAAPRVLAPRYFDDLLSVGANVAAVMIDTSAPGWDPTWDVVELERLQRLARPRQIEVVLTTWPEPNKRSIDAMAHGMPALLAAAGAAAWEIDTEFNWKPARVRGFRAEAQRSALDFAGDYLVESMLSAAAPLDVRLELTTFTSHTENGRAADVAPMMHRIVPQAYSVRHREGKTIDWNHIYGPGQMQKLTLDRALLVRGLNQMGPKLACGLAAYDQNWPGHTPEEAMRAAYDAALRYDPAEIRYWSSKWIIGAQSASTPYAARFLRSLPR